MLIRHLFNKEISKQVAGYKTIQTLRHAKTLGQEVEMKLKKYKGLNDDDLSVMLVSTTSQLDPTIMDIQRDTGRKSTSKCKFT